jgi:hypothetical protein
MSEPMNDQDKSLREKVANDVATVANDVEQWLQERKLSPKAFIEMTTLDPFTVAGCAVVFRELYKEQAPLRFIAMGMMLAERLQKAAHENVG